MEQANTFPPTGYIQVPEIVDANMTDSSITSIGNPDCQLQQTVMQGGFSSWSLPSAPTPTLIL